jgi:hypothetical protein
LVVSGPNVQRPGKYSLPGQQVDFEQLLVIRFVHLVTNLAGEGRRFAGCEIDPKLVKVAKCRVAEALAERNEETKS